MEIRRGMMKLEINNVNNKLLGEIANLIAGTEATIKVIKDKVEEPKEKPNNIYGIPCNFSFIFCTFFQITL